MSSHDKTILFLNNDMIIRLHYCEYGNDGLDGGWMSTVSSQNRAIPCAAPSVRGEEVQRSYFSYSKILITDIDDICHDCHDQQWCTFFQACVLFCKENAKFWPVSVPFGYLRTFG